MGDVECLLQLIKELNLLIGELKREVNMLKWRADYLENRLGLKERTGW
jgi:hypothetical protein